MSNILADKYKNDNYINILQSEYTIITNSKDRLELELKPKASLSCSEVFLFKNFLEKEEKKQVDFKIKYKDNQVSHIISEWDEMVKCITVGKPIMEAMLKNSSIEFLNNEFIISLPIKGANFLYDNKYDKEINNIFREVYSTNYNLVIKDKVNKEFCENISLDIQEEEENLKKTIINDIKIGNKNEETREENTGETSLKDNYVKSYNASSDFKIQNLILGKNRRKDLPLVKIGDIKKGSGNIKVEGDILSFHSLNIKNDKAIVMINVFDGTNSIPSKSFVLKEDLPEIENRLHKADNIRVFGKVEYDSYFKELIIKGSTVLDITENDIDNLNKEINKEENNNKKNIENNNNNNNIVNIVQNINRNITFELESEVIEIEEPIQMNLLEELNKSDKNKNKLQNKYLTEFKKRQVEDIKSALSFPKNQNIKDATYCILDIETTGLEAKNDKITELAVIKYKDGKIIDQFETFVNPEISIPVNITELTGITDAMVKDARKIEAIIPDFLDFIGSDSILVAHNAEFDMGFIKHNVNILNLEMNNKYLDTLALARMLYMELSRFSQGVIAKHLKIKVEIAHRAMDDVKVLSEIFKHMLIKLQNNDIRNWDELDKYS